MPLHAIIPDSVNSLDMEHASSVFRCLLTNATVTGLPGRGMCEPSGRVEIASAQSVITSGLESAMATMVYCP